MTSKITIGTRSSKLSLWQANYVRNKLLELCSDLEVLLKEIKTKGDHIIDVALSKIGGKGLFTKEIEDALLSREIDLAVHSLKDLPTKLPPGLELSAVLSREPPHDVLIVSPSIKSQISNLKFNGLPKGSKIGTSSLRRIAQLKATRPDLEYIDLRGNLDTRIRKLEEGQLDAIVLAYAGVKRLGFELKITEHFDPEVILPAICQGMLAIEIRENNSVIKEITSKLNDSTAYLISLAERSFLETLQGGCQVPIGAYSKIEKSKIVLYGMIASLDGKRIVKDKVEGDLTIRTAKEIGKNLACRLNEKGGKEILLEINSQEMLHHRVSIDV